MSLESDRESEDHAREAIENYTPNLKLAGSAWTYWQIQSITHIIKGLPSGK